MGKLVRLETRAGEPIQLSTGKIIPFSKVLYIQIPGLWGGVLWERPASVLVIQDDGEEEIIPIQDVSRYVVLGLIGAIALLWLFTRKKGHKA
jgi:hypothetical protein